MELGGQTPSVNWHVQSWHGRSPTSFPPRYGRVRDAEGQQPIEENTDWWTFSSFQVLIINRFRLATFRSFRVIHCICILYTEPLTYIYKLTYTILRRTSLPEIAAGTTRGNLASVTRSTRLTYLPLLINFLQVVLYKDIQNILRNPPFVYFL